MVLHPSYNPSFTKKVWVLFYITSISLLKVNHPSNPTGYQAHPMALFDHPNRDKSGSFTSSVFFVRCNLQSTRWMLIEAGSEMQIAFCWHLRENDVKEESCSLPEVKTMGSSDWMRWGWKHRYFATGMCECVPQRRWKWGKLPFVSRLP